MTLDRAFVSRGYPLGYLQTYFAALRAWMARVEHTPFEGKLMANLFNRLGYFNGSCRVLIKLSY